ncbi:restriction endonuclease subunit S [Pelagicoccus sp. SDUM812002]|uniref:restriction endonuclease subunit S n=1 Tax=Pelagicoccus sp. SDUM812002 TaxID=3041266 RepID=UPI00280E287D|nr:restriction endonuclease subunit S [Pelagicoccus sp. SDUM812002]MDQ8186809.1 restriction endonuclease subunit S [Pelagicoccus sp. SDUM812002]
MARLGDYIEEQNNPIGTPEANGLQLIGVSNEHGLHPSSQRTSADLSRYKRIEQGWFAYNPMRINVGSIGLSDDESKVGFTSPDYTVFSCREGLDPRYLLHFLKSDYGLEAIARNSSGAVRKRLYFSGLSEIELHIPSPREQAAAVSRIENISNTIRYIRDKNSDTQDLPQLKQAILQEAIQGKLTDDWRAENPDVEAASELLKRIQAEKAGLVAEKKIRKEKPLPKITNEDILFEIPESWEWCRLAEVANAIHYGYTASADPSLSETRLLRITDIQDDKVDWESVPGCQCMEKDRKKYSLTIGDILIARTGGTVGKSFLVDSLPVQSVFASYLVRIIPSLLEIAIFTKLYLGSPCYWSQIVDAARGAQPNVSGSKLKQLLIPLPPLAEQAVIVERVEALMETCRELEAEIEHSQAHANQLLQAVLKEAFAPATT